MGSALFSDATRAWFTGTFGTATPAQEQAWPAIAAGRHTLVCAPTGSGKTLAAFLWAIDRIVTDDSPPARERLRVLYVSPLKALAVDVEKNLRAPIAGIGLAAERSGELFRAPTVALRTGDTSPAERRAIARRPPDILVTTPESLYLMLTSAARDVLRSVRTVIVDEIHAVAGTKRGAHLSLSLERLAALTPEPPQRIGLSATQRPLAEIGRFLAGHERDGSPRPVTICDASGDKQVEVNVIVPVDDLAAPPVAPPPAGDDAGGHAFAGDRLGVWPHIHREVLGLVRAHRSTIVFVNARRLAERLAASLNEMAGEDLVKAHHGSLARTQRMLVEDELKSGELRGLVATSSLELGIDMGAVDLVVQIGSPGSVSHGLQRIGRAGHHVGAASVGVIVPTHRADLLEAAVVADRMRHGLIEETVIVRHALDVLAQQLVAACALDEWDVDDLAHLVRGAAGYVSLPDGAFDSVLDLLTGVYPSDELASLRPRLVWDRIGGRVRAHEGAARVAVVNGGTIPDRGLFGVFLPDGGRVGELDEECVYESRVGEVFVLGASSWRITEITHDRVTVIPAPGRPGKVPFWKGDDIGRPIELGRALGAAIRGLRTTPRPEALARLTEEWRLDDRAARNLLAYLDEQAAATGAVPDDRTVVVERFVDEMGDWRVCVLTPFGARVHAPWAVAIEGLLSRRYESAPQVLWSDDGIAVRFPDGVDTVPIDALVPDPDEVHDLVVDALPGSAVFAAHFREAAARALLLPRRAPGRRSALWQQRRRAATLLDAVARHPRFPMLLEATRECIHDVFDLDGLHAVLEEIRARTIRVVPVDTVRASPFAQSLLLRWVAQYMYEGDAPLAERRAAALSLDRGLLRELLGRDELRDLVDPGALADLELTLARLDERSVSRVRGPDDVHDRLRELGDLTPLELAARCPCDPTPWIATLLEHRRAITVMVAGEARVAAAEDAARFRDALGAAVPRGLPGVFTEALDHPLHDLLVRYARTHGPFTETDAAIRFGIGGDRTRDVLADLAGDGRVVRGAFRPEGTSVEWCAADVLTRLRRSSLAVLRHEVEPVPTTVFAEFLAAWQGADAPRRGADALVDALALLQGATLPASCLEADILPARVADYHGGLLDALCTSGDFVWCGAGALGASDGRIVICGREHAAQLLPTLASAVTRVEPGVPATLTRPDEPSTDRDARTVHNALLARLTSSGAVFWPELVAAAGPRDEADVLRALWDLVWEGVVTNDSFGALRAYTQFGLTGRRAAHRTPRFPPTVRPRPRPDRLRASGPAAAAGRWSLFALLRRGEPSPTERAHAVALNLLERHGVITREAVRAEGVPGGFASLYPVFRALEESGRVRRGYFVDGLGAAQFALVGAVDRLRSLRPDADSTERSAPADARVLAATDPAQPYGAALDWPERAAANTPGRPSRTPGAFVVLRRGAPLAYLERGGHRILTFVDADNTWVEPIAALVRTGRTRSIELRNIDGRAVRSSAVESTLRDAGFRDTPRGLVLRG